MPATPESGRKSKLGDTLFAFAHLVALVAFVVLAFVDLAHGRVVRCVVVLAALFVYYILILHKPVRKEIRRRKDEKRARTDKSARR
jgi:Flp pilus assembly protein TadB